MLHFRKFAKEDFSWYASWFRDEEMATFLGEVDQEWLASVLSGEEGMELVVMQDGIVVGEVGIVYATADHPYHVISNVAVNPANRNKGIGLQLLREIVLLPELGGKEIRAYLSKNNGSAIRVFRRAGWKDGTEEGGMLTFCWTGE
ncbi:GNAT family N-acetyltransferase [Lewinella sp. W8]|uniref:GNAT family N-acetyltransferase n=1 Tax=Lewinella sp. W8 TaxID=2528208 RepID=UPI0010685AF8|nr:GNAT family N-acetyltransferase [Lewinella sp. W8]MTB49481.1 GNAT family N-acetyltransferase [Lewinella sp. W8]